MSQLKPCVFDDNITVTVGNDYESNDLFDYKYSGNSITFGSIPGGTSDVSVTGITVPWNTTSVSNDSYTLDPSWNNRASGKITLDGPEADIEINGESLVDMLHNIEQRLNMLKPNPELESEWAELKSLGDAYRELEAKIQDKMKTWNAISK